MTATELAPTKELNAYSIFPIDDVLTGSIWTDLSVDDLRDLLNQTAIGSLISILELAPVDSNFGNINISFVPEADIQEVSAILDEYVQGS